MVNEGREVLKVESYLDCSRSFPWDERRALKVPTGDFNVVESGE